MSKKFIPTIKGLLRRHTIELPNVIEKASGIRVNGKRIRSLIFTTDVAIIRNMNADAVIAVYPFTPQLVITQAIMTAADVPVFCGVGGGITTGKRSINLALHAEFQGAAGVVLNAPTPNELIREMAENIDIPIIITVVSEKSDFEGRLKAGASIFNVSGAAKTPDIVRKIREQFPQVPIIATGGPTEKSILKTIEAGANCITYTPPTASDLFSKIMDQYREEL